ncbi:MAG: TolB family protein, partial [Gammaproteobacteria bacterium]
MAKRLTGGVLALVLVVVLAAPAAATPPGRNGLIIWLREGPSLPHLWVANPDGSAARRVFAKAGRIDFEGTFSPTDANLVFFSGAREAPFSEGIFRGNLATGAVERVLGRRSAEIAPTVSPDGTKLAYFAVPRPRRIREDVPPPPERIRVANIDGSGDRAITARRRRSIDPDWSPDGSRLVYDEVRFVGRRQTPQNRLVVIDADGSGRRPITAFGGVSEVNPKWMPDGRSIVFEQLRDRGTRSDIATIGPNGGAVRKILATKAW